MSVAKPHGGARPGSGRKPTPAGPLVKATYRMSTEQKAKAARLGGAAWVRKVIDTTPE